MKIKLPITEKFLWDIYNLFEGTSEAVSLFGPRSLSGYLSPGFYEIRKRYQRKIGKRRFADLLYYLKKQGYIEVPEWEYKSGIMITPKGFEKIIAAQNKIKGKKLRKDGKWEMVIFDIPEKKRKLRDGLRSGLKKLGYKLLQKSVWVSPYDILEQTEKVIREHNLEDETRLLLIEEIKISQKDKGGR